MKSGLEFFPLDCEIDDKLELIEAEFGITGFGVVVKLWQRIYGRQGYYIEWTNEVALLFSKQIGLGGNVVSEIVEASIKRGIFSEEHFEKYQILTSKGIQKRYLIGVGRRKNVEMKKEYLLLDSTQIPKNVNISSENVYISEENEDISKQSKVEYSKVKESKVEESKQVTAAAVKFYESNIGTISPIIFQKLNDWLGDVDLSLIEYAVEQAVEHNKRNWSYINAIINNHFKAGRKTRVEAEGASKQKQPEKENAGSGRYDFEEIEKQAFKKIQDYGKGGKLDDI